MNGSRILLVIACVVFGLGAGESQAKKKRAPSEGVDVMCSGKSTKTFVGKLFSIQPAAREITIKTKSGSRDFRLAGNCKLATADKADAELTDLRLGAEVRVTYFTTKAETDVACAIAPADAAAKKSSK